MNKVWDGFIRFFHLSLIILITTAYFSIEYGQIALHLLSGYTLLALFITRLIWGVIGSDTAKLTSLFHHPRAVIASLIHPNADPQLGHNPAGSYMVWLFFSLILIQLLTGLMSSDEVFVDGPLVPYISNQLVSEASALHQSNFDWLVAAIGIHMLAILIYRLRGKPLTRAMISGYRSPIKNAKHPKLSASPAPSLRRPHSAFVIFLVTWGMIMATWGLEPLQETWQLITSD